jgi:hypothetical protein
MERDNLSCLGFNRQRTQQKVNHIVDDPRSSYPSSLLLWLRLQLKLIEPINNIYYAPQNIPPAA